MSLITDDEKLVLPEFREKVEDLLDDDFTRSDEYLLRWIRDRDLNLHAAEIMLRKHFIWRRAFKMDSSLSELRDEYLEVKCPYKVDSFDRKGRPIVEMPAGDWKARDLVEAGKAEQLCRRVWMMMEEGLMATRRTKHSNSKDVLPLAISIVDLANLSYRQIGTKEVLATTLHIIKAICDNYPEVLETTYVINAPTFFKIIFKILKAVIPSRYIARTFIFGRNPNEWQRLLLEIVSPEQLRKRYGGNKED